MKPVSPEDRPKLIGLAIAVVLVFLVGGINVLRSVSGGGAPAPAAAPSVAAVAAAGATPGAGATAAPAAGAPAAGAPAAPVATAAAAGLATIVESNGALPAPGPQTPTDVLAIQQPNYGADPFRPIVPSKPLDMPIPGLAPPSFISQVSTAPLIVPSPVGRPSAPAAPVLPAPVVIPLRLTGVVGGVNALAMIGDGVTQHFLHRGDTFMEYTVVQIDEDSVTLRHGDTGKILRVGAGDPENISFGPSGSTSNKPETKVVATKPDAQTATPAGTLLTKAGQSGRN